MGIKIWVSKITDMIVIMIMIQGYFSRVCNYILECFFNNVKPKQYLIAISTRYLTHSDIEYNWPLISHI